MGILTVAEAGSSRSPSSLESSSTFLRVLQKTTVGWVKLSFVYRSDKVSSFESFVIIMKNCWIPSRVSCSFLTRILTGSCMKSRTKLEEGSMVAERNTTCMSWGRSRFKTDAVASGGGGLPLLKGKGDLSFRCNISSASSIIRILIFSDLRASRFIKSNTRPEVPTTMWTPLSSFWMSWRVFLPPMHTQHLTFMNCPMARTTFWICRASSRVGARMSACGPPMDMSN